MNIAIIGGGACGLLLASLLEKLNISYTIFNKGKIGRKILASGNGKCNIANRVFEKEKYHNNPLAIEIISKQQIPFFDYLKELKIYTKEDDEGRMYPMSESSLSVFQAIMKKVHGPIIDCEIKTIHKKNGFYILNGEYGGFDKVVIATGSIANFKKPYPLQPNIIQDNIKFHEFKPSLVGFTTNPNFKEISGVRHKCRVGLYQNKKCIHSEHGEVIFKDRGISGICIMNLSSYYNHLKEDKNCEVVLDLSDQEYDDYTTILPPKLLNYVKTNNIPIHSFSIPISGVYDFENAQVCSGGIAIDEIQNNLKLKKDNNIFTGGEVIDVDGVCGGYNLMFAFCCAMTIYEELKNEISN